jgi:hypothetical protein
MLGSVRKLVLTKCKDFNGRFVCWRCSQEEVSQFNVRTFDMFSTDPSQAPDLHSGFRPASELLNDNEKASKKNRDEKPRNSYGND